MLDREYEQYLQNQHYAVEKNKAGFLWIITAATILVPLLWYVVKI